MTSPRPVLLRFTRDLRLADHPALTHALDQGVPVIPVFILNPAMPRPLGEASRWWLHHSLGSLSRSLDALGGRLILRQGEDVSTLLTLAAETGAGMVIWTTSTHPDQVRQDAELRSRLDAMGVDGRALGPDLLFTPSAMRTKTGGPFQVFTPFWRHGLGQHVAPPLPAPTGPWPAPTQWPHTGNVDALGLLPTIKWWTDLPRHWQPGEAGAMTRLTGFLDRDADDYHRNRDLPGNGLRGRPATSRLSAHLAWGEISPRQIWRAVHTRPATEGAQVFLKEVGWREFSHHLLMGHPHLHKTPLRPEFTRFPWRDDHDGLARWQRGRTGYPIVDAGMRELWATGWMHNRVRMIAASFLIKDLLIPWQWGEEWFWDTLVDADPASNPASWQWVAGCGADAAPFFRIFNPVLQGQKFDPDGTYVRHWLPELARLPDDVIHQPWQAPSAVLAKAGVRLDSTYPAPIIDHGHARNRALAALRRIQGKDDGQQTLDFGV